MDCRVSFPNTSFLWESLINEFQRDLYPIQNEDTTCTIAAKSITNIGKRSMVCIAGTIVAVIATPFFLSLDLFCFFCISENREENEFPPSYPPEVLCNQSDAVNRIENARIRAQEIFVDFYLNRCPNLDNVTIEQILHFSNEALESQHNYIQWLFITDRPSQFNASAPTVTPEIQRAFEQDGMRINLNRAYRKMLNFWGFEHRELNSNDLERPAHLDANLRRWLTQGNHNMLRMDRVVNSLCLLGQKEWAKAFYRALESLYAEMPEARGIIRNSLNNYWRPSILTHCPEMRFEISLIPEAREHACRLLGIPLNRADDLPFINEVHGRTIGDLTRRRDNSGPLFADGIQQMINGMNAAYTILNPSNEMSNA